MRVLIVCPDAPYPPRDGGSLRIVNLARSLTAQADVMLMTYVRSAGETRSLEDFERATGVRVRAVQRPARRNLATRAWHKLTLYYGSYLLSAIPGPVRFNLRPIFGAALRETLADFKPDVIVWEYWFMSGFAEQARQDAPQAVQVLDTIDLEWVRLRRLVDTRRGLRAWWTRFTWPRVRRYTFDRYQAVDRVVTLTQTDAHIAQRECPDLDRWYVLPMGLMLDDYPDLGAGHPDRLAFFGSFRHTPNVDAVKILLSDIFPRIRRDRPTVVLDIMGPALPDRLIERIRSETGVRYLGVQPDIRPVLAETAVVIAPLRFGSGVKIKLLEAMALGKAVVTTSIGAEGIEAAPDADWIVADDPAAIAHETIRLLDDEVTRHKVGQRGRAHVHRHYDARHIADDLIAELRGERREHGR